MQDDYCVLGCSFTYTKKTPASVHGQWLQCSSLPLDFLQENMQRTAEPPQGHFGPECNSSLFLEPCAAPHSTGSLKWKLSKLSFHCWSLWIHYCRIFQNFIIQIYYLAWKEMLLANIVLYVTWWKTPAYRGCKQHPGPSRRPDTINSFDRVSIYTRLRLGWKFYSEIQIINFLLDLSRGYQWVIYRCWWDEQ